MNTHLTPEHLAEWLDADDHGEAGDPVIVHHLANCQDCRGLVDRMELYFKAAAATLVDDGSGE